MKSGRRKSLREVFRRREFKAGQSIILVVLSALIGNKKVDDNKIYLTLGLTNQIYFEQPNVKD
jgi:hypothetical protein